MNVRLPRRAVLLGAFALSATGVRARAADVGGVKVVWVMTRAPGVGGEAFVDAWQGGYGARLGALPGVRGAVFSQVASETVRTDIQRLGADVDGIVEIWFDSPAAAATALGEGAGRAWTREGARLVGQSAAFLTRETVFVPVRARTEGSVKAVSLIVRKAPLTPEVFVREWMQVHGPMATHVPGLSGFVASEIIAGAPAGPGAPSTLYPLDGIAESWSSGPEARALTLASAEGRQWYADGARIMGRIRTLVTREQVIAPPPY
jgi:hypothetical protein